MNLKLDPVTHDIFFSNFRLATLVTKAEDLGQRLKVKLLLFKGEWFLNINYGVPYYQEVFVRQSSKDKVDDIFRAQIASEDGVVDLLSYSSVFNTSTRSFAVTASVMAESGEIQTISLEI